MLSFVTFHPKLLFLIGLTDTYWSSVGLEVQVALVVIRKRVHSGTSTCAAVSASFQIRFIGQIHQLPVMVSMVNLPFITSKATKVRIFLFASIRAIFV